MIFPIIALLDIGVRPIGRIITKFSPKPDTIPSMNRVNKSASNSATLHVISVGPHQMTVASSQEKIFLARTGPTVGSSASLFQQGIIQH